MKHTTCLSLLGALALPLFAGSVPANQRSIDEPPKGLAKSDWSSIRAAYEAGRHAFHAVDGGFQARNPGQQWLTKFDGRGFRVAPKDGGWEWGLELESYGFPGQERRHSRPAVVSANGQRLTLAWDGCLEEWLINDQRGLEHGFTVKERPPLDCGSLLPLSVSQPAAGQAGKVLPPSQAHPRQQAAITPKRQQAAAVQELCFTLAVRGGLRPEIAADAQAVNFVNEAGAAVLTYSGLKVWDAEGKTLPAHFEPAGSRLRLLVDERGARYPITIDPIAQQAYLKPAGVEISQAGDRFGQSVAVSGDTVVVGASLEDSSTTGVNSTPNELAANAGAAYVFVRSGTTWAQEAYLKPDAVGTTQAGDQFGIWVAVSGDTVIVGAYLEDGSATGVNGARNELVGGSGAAYIFVRSGGAWTQQAYLKPAAVGTTQAGDQFGFSVAVSGDTAVVGAVVEDSSTTGVNSTPNDDGTANDSGAAYVFLRSGTTWTQQAYLKPDAVGTTQAGDRFGQSVAVSGDTLVVGASLEDSNTLGVNATPNELATNSGAAYVFVRSGGAWTQQAYLKPAAVGTTQAQDRVGFAVAISGDTVVVGAPEEDSGMTGINSTPNESAANAGAAYVFLRSGTTWTQQASLKPAAVGTTQAGDRFGQSVAISVDTVLVGASMEDSSTTGVVSTPNDDGTAADSGAAYVFVRSGVAWTQQAYLKPAAVGTTQVNDQFGWSVAVSGDTGLVGAPLEDSSTMGLNTTPNESASDAGAAYVFLRGGTTWTQQAYLKPASFGTTQADQFGFSVAVSGDTVIVGAPFEDSSTTGINSRPNELDSDSGAAYVFVRSGGAWSQQAYLKPAAVGTTQVGDRFGISVAVSGDTVVVGAPEEDSGMTGINSTPNELAGNAGAAYVFTRSGTTWTPQAYLKPAAVGTTQDGDEFGSAVAIAGDTVVVGAPFEDSTTTGVNNTPNDTGGLTDSGAAYVFVRSGTIWTQQAFLKPAAVGTTQDDDRFGSSVAVSGDTVVVGAYWESSNTTGINSTANEGAFFSGAAYVFARSGTTWTQQAYLKPAAVGTTQVNDQFGWSVAVSGDTVVVGAYGEASSTTGVNSMANESAPVAGAAYVFVNSGGTWSQQAYLKPAAVGTTQAGDRFGISVAVSGDTVVVGANGEASNTTGINTTADESADLAGAAYVFVRSGGAWSQQAYLKPAAVGTTQVNDQFGWSAAVSGDTVVVGTPGEDSSTMGINSTADEGANDAGAAYVFSGLGPSLVSLASWRQTHFGTSANTGNAANDFDFESDGWKNLVEYGVNTNPTTHGETGLSLGLQAYSGSNYLRTIFTRDPARDDVTIRVEAAASMTGPWTTVATSINGAATTGAGLVSETDLGGGLKQVEVRDTVPTSTANPPRRFLRITVQE